MVKPKRVFSLMLRLIALGATLSAAIVMATSHETGSLFGVSFEAKYTDMPAFKYLVIANAIAAVYSLLVLFLPSETLLWRLVAVLDFVITMILVSSISAALAIAQVGKNGNSHAGWLPACGQVAKYCNHVTGALIAGFIAVMIYIILLFYSVHTVANPLLEKA